MRKTRIDGVMGDEAPSDELAADIEAINDRPVVVLKITGSGFDRERSQHMLAFAKNVLSRQYAPHPCTFQAAPIPVGRVALNLTHAFKRGLSAPRSRSGAHGKPKHRRAQGRTTRWAVTARA